MSIGNYWCEFFGVPILAKSIGVKEYATSIAVRFH